MTTASSHRCQGLAEVDSVNFYGPRQSSCLLFFKFETVGPSYGGWFTLLVDGF